MNNLFNQKKLKNLKVKTQIWFQYKMKIKILNKIFINNIVRF